jgi:CMP-N,N'-diacetyllegionaminic acid synthase
MTYDFVDIFIPVKTFSSRVPHKNIRQLNTLLLFEYSLKVALKLNYVKNIYVDSNSIWVINFIKKKYKNFVHKNKIILIKRPNFLIKPEIKVVDVIIYYLDNKFLSYKYLLLLQPTHPFRQVSFIEDAIKKFIKSNLKLCISSSNINNKMVTNGSFYIFRSDYDFLFDKNEEYYDFIYDNIFSNINIDTYNDFKFARIISNRYLKFNGLP